ncbi:Uncharacterized conserved protein YbjT, contains NAD(P)-binding and DUF2867 domains [Actinacidiphila yanglinensis]|uniref:Uncharacterized conserved protein YbjT, contains NAD(P)-binding and DUF2867 domains n=1 Tax=Actinacidiphila yanglinensis TaxID=310779 RepID=A0A1H6DPI9_9ACTN|nr:NAD(P)H-binding protein [Actinacidiphila yanglinensis]SEG87121.1 Uncharacterized conserved protein YbjT, contains NAD(P)-binding and DUF2867 domains [Actinacidiphila yanglinensis]
MLLITGATGRIGRELVPLLTRRQGPVRVLVREASRAAGLPAGTETVVADLTDPSKLPAALEGVDRLFLLFPGIDHAAVDALLAAARTAGVERLVYLSSYAVGIDPMPAMGKWHFEREELIAGHGIPATVLRPCGFMSNTLDWLATLRSDGVVLDPVGPGRAALVDPADIAAVAVEALTDDRHVGRTYTLTGDQPLTVREQVRVLETVIGRNLPVREVATPEEAVRFRYPDGAPPALAAALVEGLRLMRADTKGLVTTDVEQVTGHAPHSFESWCRRHADAFRTGLDTLGNAHA